MNRCLEMLFGITAGILLPAAAMGGVATDAEFQAVKAWSARLLEPGAADSFFSFNYNGQPVKGIPGNWTVKRSECKLDDARTEFTVSFTDPATGLTVRYVAEVFSDFPAIEWTVYLKNEGEADTPIIENLLPLDAGFPLTRDKEAFLLHANGSECRLDDFEPKISDLGPNSHNPQGEWRGEKNPLRLESKGGRSSCGALPFFNIEMAGKGAVLAIGWTGDWAATFFRNDKELRAAAGMKRTHFKLLPGEEVRTPRIMLLFWEGDSLRGNNLLRQFILSHHTPKVNGQRALAPLSNPTWGGNFADKHIEHGLWWKQNGLPLDYYWIDAGWFGEDEAKPGATVFNSAWGRLVGDWSANTGYYPKGLKQVSDALKQAGVGLLLWVESERVFKETRWTREHPEYLLGPMGDSYLYNLGDTAARKFLTDFLAELIDQNSLGCYRQDFNMDPRPYWDALDAPDRLGIAEIRHITGLYAMWDELLQRFPHLLIDNCSSGGRRIDLETISRSIPLWRSDVQCWPGFGITAMQAQTHGLGMWVPLSAGCCDREDTYVFRSALGPGMDIIMYDFEQDTSKHFSVDWLKARLAEFQAARPYFEGDFYPLVSYSLKDDVWAAWQYHRTDMGEGMLLAFRRNNSPFTAMTPTLNALEPDAAYEIRCLDSGQTRTSSGRELLEKGLEIRIDERPGSRIFMYRKVK